ncbi:hypothetical protein CEXT_512341 [Caerostris extrusa]|uniref:Uncharacterized protein n=1 Tax=Caerostris extrusa TaxID=172846 RepID=A0AAV4TDD5_CAEEX|nr:hypothetical protein CEXT_512341 [Caerostris extrusa]
MNYIKKKKKEKERKKKEEANGLEWWGGGWVIMRNCFTFGARFTVPFQIRGIILLPSRISGNDASGIRAHDEKAKRGELVQSQQLNNIMSSICLPISQLFIWYQNSNGPAVQTSAYPRNPESEVTPPMTMLLHHPDLSASIRRAQNSARRDHFSSSRLLLSGALRYRGLI